MAVDPESAQRSIERAARSLVYKCMWPFDDIGEARALSSRITAALVALELGTPERVEIILEDSAA